MVCFFQLSLNRLKRNAIPVSTINDPRETAKQSRINNHFTNPDAFKTPIRVYCEVVKVDGCQKYLIYNVIPSKLSIQIESLNWSSQHASEGVRYHI